MSTSNGTAYEKLISEDFYKTPDMGEYMNNYIYLQNQEGLSDEIDTAENTAYFVETPPVTDTRYYPDLEVVSIKVDPKKVQSIYMNEDSTKYNYYDGDTLVLDLDCIEDDTAGGFKMYYDNDTLFSSVKHYLTETLSLSNGYGQVKIRFVGLNAPEIVHYSTVISDTIDGTLTNIFDIYNTSDVFWCTYSDLRSGEDSVHLNNKNGNVFVNKANITYRTYDGTGEYTIGSTKDIELKEYHEDTKMHFLRLRDDTKDRYCQIIKLITKDNATTEQIENEEYSTATKTVREIVLSASSNNLPVEAYAQAEYAQKIVRDAFTNATDCVILLDTIGMNGVKSQLPEAYRQKYEQSSSSPWEVVYSMWKNLKGEKAAYRYAGYRVPGQEANGRFLGAIYLKTVNNGVAQWINLNKKVIYECNGTGAKGDMTSYTEVRPAFSNSIQSQTNDNYLAKGFKMWTYTDYTKLYVDGASQRLFDMMDDREEVQRQITGCNLEQLGEYTAMIGDTLLMIPPTSIRSITQTKAMKTHLIRSRGSVTKQLPKTERIIELDLYFNGDEGINGIPYIQTLPNGNEITYYMNGLRGLLAQFKLAPFLPIHNNYINNVLNIDAVALANITVETMQDYPRTLHVTISMYEFNWRQFMPEQSIHDLASDEGLFVNGFSKTVMFPLLRYHYQRALIKGNELKAGQYDAVNTVEYIEQTIGSQTSLQPMDFASPSINFYVPSNDKLSNMKQNKINMQSRPLGRTYTFTDIEKEFMAAAYEINQMMVAARNAALSFVDSINNTKKITLGLTSGYDIEYEVNKNFFGDNYIYLSTTGENTKDKAIFEAIHEMIESMDAVYQKYKSKLATIFTGFVARIKIDSLSATKKKISIIVEARLTERYRGTDSTMVNIKNYCAKYCEVEANKIFSSDGIYLSFSNTFSGNIIQLPTLSTLSTSFYESSAKFTYNEDETHKAIAFLAKLVDSASTENMDDFDITTALDKIKEYMDVESAESMSFDLIDFGPNAPVITSIVTSYNNIYANASLKAIDGHAAQFTGGSDTSIVVNMIGDEEVVATLNWMSRVCIDYMINYRKVLLCSPLRIDCELAKFIGVHEVIIESIDVNTIPNQPKIFNISLTLNSVDRTLRNRENLTKIKDIDNATADFDAIIDTKNYFDLKNVLGKAELYPDLELPTIEELEMAGFYFLKTNYTPTGRYADPDFYFVYLYPTLANNIRTTLTNYFSDPENLNYLAQGDLFQESMKATLGIRKAYNSGQIFKIDDDGYDGELNTATIYKDIADYMVQNKLLREKYKDRYKSTMEEMDQIETVLSYLDESITNATYNTFNPNSITCITVKDEDLLYTPEEQESDESLAKDDSAVSIKEEFCKTSMDELNSNVLNALIAMVSEDISIRNPLVKSSQKKYFIPFDYAHRKITTGNNSSIEPAILNVLYKALTGSEPEFGYGSGLNADGIDKRYSNMIVRAGAVGKMATVSMSKATSSDIKCKNDSDNTPSCYPSIFESYVKDGKIYKSEVVYYPSNETQELQTIISEDDDSEKYMEQLWSAVQYGSYGIERYKKDVLQELLGIFVLEDGFLDPYVNNDVRTYLGLEKFDKETLKANQITYMRGISKDLAYAEEAYQRMMAVWAIILCKKNALINESIFCATKLVELKDETDGNWLDSNKLADLGKTVLNIKSEDTENHVENYGVGLEWLLWNQNGVNQISDLISAVGKKFNPSDDESKENTITEDDLDPLAENAVTKEDLDNADSSIEAQVEAANTLIKTINENCEYYLSSLVHGLLYTVSAIAMDGVNSPVYKAVVNGELATYQGIIENAGSMTTDTEDVSNYTKHLARFVQYLDYYFGSDLDAKNNKNDLLYYNYNTQAQKAYLAAANDPSVYLLHSYYDMVMNDKRGTMARAFPTYYMLLIDEGRSIGLWRLQDNFYNMNSIVEFEVVRSRKIAADTARIVMTNAYGVFTSDDEDQKDEMQYTFKDVWNSIFSPRVYFQSEYTKRRDAREINRAKMQPGARVHLRAGYGSNAADLPILFNGVVAEFEAGEVMTLVCQGDGVELSNPNMFNAVDANDVQDILSNDDFFIWKSIIQKTSSLSTPRDLLVLPLSAHGTFIQEIVKKWSSSRLFGANIFGITHFGDKKYNAIFPTNGETEQNIYECLSKPAWNWAKSGQGDYMEIIANRMNDSYEMDSAPKIRVALNNGFSYWDLMGIAASMSPEFISAIAPFQLRSTIFYGAPHYYYAYDYERAGSKILEKRKPYQQSHIITSYSDIIDNKMTTSRNFNTNVVGHYGAPGWMSTVSKTIGPLWADIDIFPENQRTTSVDLNFEYKTNDLFNIPLLSKTQEMFEWTDGPNGKKIAWRAAASYLKDNMKDMYSGEIIIMGNPSIKPYDRLRIADVYEDISGTVEVEQVVQMFSTTTGFTTSITPDLITAVDNKFETLDNAVTAQTIVPAVVAFGLNVKFGLSFNANNRPLYLSIARAFGKGEAVVSSAVNKAVTALGKETVQKDASLIGRYLDDGLKTMLSITTEDVKLDSMVRSISELSKAFNMPSSMGPKTYLKMLSKIDNLEDILSVVSNSSVDDITALLKNYYKMNEVANSVELLNLTANVEKIKALASIDANSIKEMSKAVEAIATKTDDVQNLSNILTKLAKNNKNISLIDDEGKALVKTLQTVISKTEDFTKSGLGDVVKPFSTMMEDMADVAKAFSKIDDVTDTARTFKHAIRGLKGAVSSFLPGLILLGVEAILTKSVKNWITGELKNLQVLTMYPVYKENKVWTAGIEGHSGSVYGSLTYDTPGWLEQCAIDFFDYGNTASIGSGAWVLSLLREVFISTPEMKAIVNNFKRNNTGINVDEASTQVEQSAIIDAKNYLDEKIALSEIRVLSDFQNMFLTSRISMSDIASKTTSAVRTCAKYRFNNIDNIETTNDISSQLVYIPTSCDIISTMYDNKTFNIVDTEMKTSDPVSGKALEVKLMAIQDYNSTGARMVYAKEITDPENVYKIYDIPYLRPDACKLLNYVVELVLQDLQPDYQSPYCDFSKMKEHPIVIHSATRVNGSEGWRSTGFLFTMEVKNYNNFSNIVSDMLSNQDKIIEGLTIKTECFSVKKESRDVYGNSTYTFFVLCPEE